MQAAAVADLQVRTGKVLAGEIISSEIRKGGEGGEGGGAEGCCTRGVGPVSQVLFSELSCSERTQFYSESSQGFFHPRNYSTGSEDPSVIDVIRVG